MGHHQSRSTATAAMVVVLSLVAASCGGAEADPSTTTATQAATAPPTTEATTTTTTTTTAAPTTTKTTAAPTTPTFTPAVDPELAIATVEAAIAAYNAGDIDGWFGRFAPDSEETECDTWGCFVQILMNANEQIEILQPCELVDPSTVGCEVFISNDFHGPAGITSTSVATFEIDADLNITNWDNNAECCDAQIAFNFAFHRWLRETHREAFEQIRPQSDGSLPGFERDVENMTIARGYIAEFIEASDEYPLTD